MDDPSIDLTEYHAARKRTPPMVAIWTWRARIRELSGEAGKPRPKFQRVDSRFDWLDVDSAARLHGMLQDRGFLTMPKRRFNRSCRALFLMQYFEGLVADFFEDGIDFGRSVTHGGVVGG